MNTFLYIYIFRDLDSGSGLAWKHLLFSVVTAVSEGHIIYPITYRLSYLPVVIGNNLPDSVAVTTILTLPSIKIQLVLPVLE